MTGNTAATAKEGEYQYREIESNTKEYYPVILPRGIETLIKRAIIEVHHKPMEFIMPETKQTKRWQQALPTEQAKWFSEFCNKFELKNDLFENAPKDKLLITVWYEDFSDLETVWKLWVEEFNSAMKL